MRPVGVRTACAILAAAITSSGLRGIAVLAEASPPPLQVVTMPTVVIRASAAHVETTLASRNRAPMPLATTAARSNVP